MPVSESEALHRSTLDDHALVTRVAGGDEQALSVLYDRFAPVLYGLALRITAEPADAEEVVLDTFSQAWREAGRFRAERASAGAWLTMMCRSRALDLVRARTRRGRAVDRAAALEGEPALGQPGPPPDAAAIGAEEARALSVALEELPAPQRTALELAFFDGLSHAEIATRLAEPLGTVKGRIRTAMTRLRTALAGLGPERSR
ncbi:MAG: sigma-70 family RNA polymerase sigma factor [Gemmatimonadetes bacterium]|nr:sigma-70 family RNA polymerase sigma factor [Gemmatimonadota bacterium]